jgi:hypothetical protein
MQIRLSQPRQSVHSQPGRWSSLHAPALLVVHVVAAMAIWPSAHLAVGAYDATGFVTLLAFMGFVFVRAIALGIVAVKLLASANPAKGCPGPDPGLKTLAIRICSSILIWRESLSAK